jgi:pyruvate, water dikinase
MCEIPSKVILAEKFAECFDGFSIVSNGLTQLTLGIDLNSEQLADLLDEQDEAVTTRIARDIPSVHKLNRSVGLCIQAPSDQPEFGRFLVQAVIDSVSVSPDSFLQVKQHMAAAESERPLKAVGA